MNKIIINTGSVYKLDDFLISNLLKNDKLISELDMKTLPETFMNIFGIDYSDSYYLILKRKIELYDKSQAVNSFIYKGKFYWLDKQQRSCIKTITESNLETIDIILDNQIITLSSDLVKQFILNLEVYAYKCNANTIKHLQTISEIYDPEDLINYDYTTGYPEKVILE